MAGKRNTKFWQSRKKAVGRAPSWLKTVAISKPARHLEHGSFGAASDCISIDPATGNPREAA